MSKKQTKLPESRDFPATRRALAMVAAFELYFATIGLGSIRSDAQGQMPNDRQVGVSEPTEQCIIVGKEKFDPPFAQAIRTGEAVMTAAFSEQKLCANISGVARPQS